MTTGMTKEQTKDLTPRARAPPAQVPIMRRSRSLSELPGSVRVPILKRTDNERMRARLEAGVQGLEELRLLREQQQKQMEEVRSSALQKKPVTSQNGRISQSQPQLNQRRMSTASLRLSSQSLARINEEGDDNGGGHFPNGRLQDCTNFGNFKQGHRRHSSFSLEACRNRMAVASTDTDVFENGLSAGPEILRKTNSWSSLPASYNCRSVSSESLNESDNETSNQFANFQNHRRNQRSLSFSAIPSSSYIHHVYRRDNSGGGNNENIEPMLRRGSIQCEAVITGANNKKNLGIFKDVDISNISTDSPGPLHAVLQSFKVNQYKQNDKPANRLSNGIPKRAESFSGGTPRVQKTAAPCSKQVNYPENDMSPRNNVQRVVTHRRALSETDSTLTLSKGISLPDNIHDLGEGTVNNFFQKYNQGRSTQNMNMRNDKHNSYIHHDGKFPEARVYRRQVSSEKDQRTATDSSKQSRGTSSTNNSLSRRQSPEENDPERRQSEGNVFVEEGTSAPPESRQEEQKDRDDKDTSRATDPKHSIEQENQSKVTKKQEDENRQPKQSQNKTTVSKQEMEFRQTSPVQISIHEKKFSIASDEGYVTSPPSTPRGRQAHSIISDSSWISTDLDDTSSSCEPSPVHMPRDLGVKVTCLQLKRSDFPQDYSKAKLSRRSSDYGSMSESTGAEHHRRPSDCERDEHYDNESRRVGEGARQELFKYDGDSRPFRQTAV